VELLAVVWVRKISASGAPELNRRNAFFTRRGAAHSLVAVRPFGVLFGAAEDVVIKVSSIRKRDAELHTGAVVAHGPDCVAARISGKWESRTQQVFNLITHLNTQQCNVIKICKVFSPQSLYRKGEGTNF
jgi:hypothetical protein